MEAAPKFHVLNAQNANVLLDSDVFDEDVMPEQLSAFVDDPNHDLIFATVDNVPVGIASGAMLLHPDKAPAFFIAEVGVNEEWRRLGIASGLVSRLIRLARKKGSVGIWLATELDNDEARGLYRKLNARETQDIVVYDWDGAMDD